MLNKSITGAARIATREGPDGTREAASVAYVARNGEQAEFPPTAEGIERMIETAREQAAGRVPIIAMTDCMYDLAIFWRHLARHYDIQPTAKGPGDVYALKLIMRDTEQEYCTIFDMRHIMPRGVPAMAEVIGVDRDGTAATDCRIMIEYIENLEEQYDLRTDGGDLLGAHVMSLTSLARHEIRADIGRRRYWRRRGRGYVPRALKDDYAMDARMEAPRTYEEYATRRACMRGGFTFVSAREAGAVHGRTIELDETSAYHAQVACRFVPERFRPMSREWLQRAAERVARKTPQAVMAGYCRPFSVAFHAQVAFHGLRLKPGTVFDRQEIGLAGTARLYATSMIEGIDYEAAAEAERGIRERGYGDTAEAPRIAFSKIMEARTYTTWVNEIELWCMAQVYTWDLMEVVRGEGTAQRKRPNDESVLTSMHFWQGKQDMKAAIAEAAGTPEERRLRAVYGSEVKPKFNAIGYGIHARDEYRPGWTIAEDGTWSLEPPITPEDFDERKPQAPKAWYTYGMRIAAGARMHLILAMQLIYAAFGDDARILAGDTDSLKIRTDMDASDLIAALQPLHDATREALRRTTSRATQWHDYDPMDGVGEFIAEGEPQEAFYTPGVKQYITVDAGGRVHLTLSGIPRHGETSYEAWLQQMVDRYGEGILLTVFTFNCTLDAAVSQLTMIDYSDAHGRTLPCKSALDYTLNDATLPEHFSTIKWQREHGRSVPLQSIARAVWQGGRARFIYTEGVL